MSPEGCMALRRLLLAEKRAQSMRSEGTSRGEAILSLKSLWLLLGVIPSISASSSGLYRAPWPSCLFGSEVKIETYRYKQSPRDAWNSGGSAIQWVGEYSEHPLVLPEVRQTGLGGLDKRCVWFWLWPQSSTHYDCIFGQWAQTSTSGTFPMIS